MRQCDVWCLALSRRYLASAGNVPNAVYCIVVVLRSGMRPRDFHQRHHVTNIFARQSRAVLGCDVSVPVARDILEIGVLVAVGYCAVPADQFASPSDEFNCVHRTSTHNPMLEKL